MNSSAVGEQFFPHSLSPNAEISLRVRVFGSLRVEAGDSVFAACDLGGPKPKRLFEILLLARGHAVSKSALADHLWGEDLPKNIDATLENYVSILRRKLFDCPQRARKVLVTEHGAYRLDRTAVECDVDVFLDLIRLASSEESTSNAAELYERALSLAQGFVLEDEPYADWVLSERRRIVDQVMDAHIEAGELALRADRIDAARAHATAVRDLQPLDERAVRLAMRAAIAVGNPQQAFTIYEECRQGLADEFGAEPTAPTRALFAQMTNPTEVPLERDLPSALLREACINAEQQGGSAAVESLLCEAAEMYASLQRSSLAFGPTAEASGH